MASPQTAQAVEAVDDAEVQSEKEIVAEIARRRRERDALFRDLLAKHRAKQNLLRSAQKCEEQARKIDHEIKLAMSMWTDVLTGGSGKYRPDFSLPQFDPGSVEFDEGLQYGWPRLPLAWDFVVDGLKPHLVDLPDSGTKASLEPEALTSEVPRTAILGILQNFQIANSISEIIFAYWGTNICSPLCVWPAYCRGCEFDLDVVVLVRTESLAYGAHGHFNIFTSLQPALVNI